MQFLRLLVLEGADLFLLEPVFRNECIDFMGLPVSEANERAVGALIIERCRAALAEMEGSETGGAGRPDFDESIDARRELLGTRQGLACAVRRSERQALEAAVSWWLRDAELMKTKEFYQERRLKDLNLDKPWSPEDDESGFGVESTFSVGRSPGNVDWS